jgi:hypothetical protein
MMSLSPGDRIRYECTGDDGLPLVRYGFVGGIAGSNGPVVVMLDGELGGDVVNACDVRPVTVTTVELLLHGTDLVDDPELRCGLIALWHAEADTAGLDIDTVHLVDTCDDADELDAELDAVLDGVQHGADHHSAHSWMLARLCAGSDSYVLRAVRCADDPDIVRVRAEPLVPSPW